MDAKNPKRPQIMVVDDIAENITLITAYFRRDYEFLTALSGQSALALLDGGPRLDCFLLDIAMPGMDGLELLQRIRSRPAYQNIPAIAVTAQNSPEEVAKIMAVGFDAHIPKPVDFVELYAAIETAIKPISAQPVP